MGYFFCCEPLGLAQKMYVPLRVEVTISTAPSPVEVYRKNIGTDGGAIMDSRTIAIDSRPTRVGIVQDRVANMEKLSIENEPLILRIVQLLLRDDEIS
jgi:hypothetical protein